MGDSGYLVPGTWDPGPDRRRGPSWKTRTPGIQVWTLPSRGLILHPYCPITFLSSNRPPPVSVII